MADFLWLDSPSPPLTFHPNPNPVQVADFLWLDQDLYLKADVVVDGKSVLVGRGKAKAVEGGEGKLVNQ